MKSKHTLIENAKKYKYKSSIIPLYGFIICIYYYSKPFSMLCTQGLAEVTPGPVCECLPRDRQQFEHFT